MLIPESNPDARTRALADKTFALARKQLVEHGGVAPMAAVFAGDELEVVPSEFVTQRDKDLFAIAVRGMVAAMAADTVLLMSEIWTLPPGYTPAQAQALFRQYGSVSAMPQRIEVVMVMIETRAGATWHASAPIVRQGRAVKLGAVRYTDASSADKGGQMCGWFAPPRPATPPGV